jgi:tetratricopeptide (TPR) repeat protein
MKKNLVFFIFLATLVSFIDVTVNYSQIAGGLDETTRTDLGGRNYIVGTVFDPAGMPTTARIRIRLASLTSREVVSTTDEYGKFIFSGLAAGSYTVNIDEDKNYQAMTQQIDIQNPRNAPAETYTISFRLIPKSTSQGKASIINSELAGVPQKAVDLYKEGIRLSQKGDIKGAVVELQAAVDKYPKFTAAVIELGVQQLKIGDLVAADKSFAHALELSPNSFEATINRGIGLFRQKLYSNAEISLRSALRIKNDSAIAHFYLGRTMMAVNRLDDAEKELEAARISSKDSYVEVHRMLTQLYIQQADYVKARQQLEIYMAANPKAADIDHLQTVLKQLETASAKTQATPKP